MLNKKDINNLFDTSLNFFKRDIKVRYANSFLGAVWIILQPLIFTLIISAVFSLIFRGEVGNAPYFLYVMIGFVNWLFFSQSISLSAKSLVINRELISNAKFPRESIVISTIASKLIDYLVNIALFFVLFFVMNQDLVNGYIIFLPILLITQISLQLGLGLIASSINVYYRDVQNAVDLLLQVLFYLTPIIYPLNIIPENLAAIIKLNPLTIIISLYRDILFNQTVVIKELVSVFFLSVLILLIGVIIFRKLEIKFADVI